MRRARVADVAGGGEHAFPSGASARQLADLLEAVQGRPLRVHLSRALERRLVCEIDRVAADLGVPLNTGDDRELELGLMAAADRGLRESESDAGVWSDPGGRVQPLPRAQRAGRRRRVRWAWRAAVTSWRST